MCRYDDFSEDNRHYLRLSAVAMVECLQIEEKYGLTEFYAECLALAEFGGLLPIQICHRATDSDQISEMRALLQPGNLLEIHNETVAICGRSLQLSLPEMKRFEGDAEKVLLEFSRVKALASDIQASVKTDGKNHVRGVVIECRILSVRTVEVSALVTIETENDFIQAFLSPEVFSRYKPIITEMGLMDFFGELEPGEDEELTQTLVVEHISRC